MEGSGCRRGEKVIAMREFWKISFWERGEGGKGRVLMLRRRTEHRLLLTG